MTYMNTTRPDNLPDFIQVGATVAWPIWTGELATATVTFIDRFRVSTNKPGIYWESTCFRTAAESIAAAGLRAA